MPRLCAWLLGLSLLVAPAAAQSPAGIAGMVRDETGMPLAQVTVTVVSTASSVTRRTTTGDDGRFALSDLPPADDYRVSAVRSGFRNFIGERFALGPAGSRTFDITLTIEVTHQIRVAAPLPEGSEQSVRQTIDEDLVRDIPLVDRGFMHLASLAPGFTGRPDYPDAQGQHYWTNNVIVDGGSDFSKWRGAPRSFYSGYGRESVRDVTVLPELFAADVGGALASVTTATTKAGGDAWHGSAFLFGRHSALASQPVFASDKPDGATAQYGSAVGGPLSIRTFLFASYDARRAREHNVVSSPVAAGVSVPTNQDERVAFFRLDHRVSDNQSITARVNLSFLRWHDEPGALTLPGAGTAITSDAHTALFTHAVQFSTATSQELRAGFSRYVEERTDLHPAVYVSRTGYSIDGGPLGPSGVGVSPEDTWEAHDTVLHEAGAHTLRVGGSGTLVNTQAASSRYQRGAYFFAGSPAVAPEPYLYMQGVITSAGATTVDSRSVAGAAFVQDDWRVASDVTIAAGLRYDIEQTTGVRNFSPATDRNNLQPRAGITWKPGGAGTVIRAAAGLYTQQQILYPIHQVQLQGVDGLASVVLSTESPAFPSFPSVLAPDIALAAAPHDIYRVATEFRNPYSLQAGGGIEQTLRGLTLSADYLYLNGYDLVSVVDVNAPASIDKPAQRSVAEADATRPLPITSGYRKLLTIGNEGRSWYRALQVRATGGLPAVRVVAAYTFAHADDQANYELPEDSHNLGAERGRAPTDIRHNLSAAITWQLPGDRTLTRGWSLATVTVVRSGRPYTVTWGDDRNGTTQNDARPGARNTAEADSYRVVDLAIAKRGTARQVSVDTRLELFNLFNTVNYDEYVGALLSPLFGQPISAFPRRRAQLAVVLRF